MSDILERERERERQKNRATRVNRTNNNNSKFLVCVLFYLRSYCSERERDLKICFHFREQSDPIEEHSFTIMYTLHPPRVNQERFHRQRTK